MRMKEKILILLRNIRDHKYTLGNKTLGKLLKIIAEDLETTPEEAKAILGYLIKYGYAEIDVKKRLTLISNEKTRRILDNLDSLISIIS